MTPELQEILKAILYLTWMAAIAVVAYQVGKIDAVLDRILSLAGGTTCHSFNHAAFHHPVRDHHAVGRGV